MSRCERARLSGFPYFFRLSLTTGGRVVRNACVWKCCRSWVDLQQRASARFLAFPLQLASAVFNICLQKILPFKVANSASLLRHRVFWDTGRRLAVAGATDKSQVLPQNTLPSGLCLFCCRFYFAAPLKWTRRSTRRGPKVAGCSGRAR